RGQLFWGRGLIPIPRSYFWFKRTDLLREVRELFGSKRRDHRAAEQRDELAVSHSITSSAATCSVSGTFRPSAFSFFRLMTNANLVGCKTGNSAGFSPLRIHVHPDMAIADARIDSVANCELSGGCPFGPNRER